MVSVLMHMDTYIYINIYIDVVSLNSIEASTTFQMIWFLLYMLSFYAFLLQHYFQYLTFDHYVAEFCDVVNVVSKLIAWYSHRSSVFLYFHYEYILYFYFMLFCFPPKCIRSRSHDRERRHSDSRSVSRGRRSRSPRHRRHPRSRSRSPRRRRRSRDRN